MTGENIGRAAAWILRPRPWTLEPGQSDPRRYPTEKADEKANQKDRFPFFQIGGSRGAVNRAEVSHPLGEIGRASDNVAAGLWRRCGERRLPFLRETGCSFPRILREFCSTSVFPAPVFCKNQAAAERPTAGLRETRLSRRNSTSDVSPPQNSPTIPKGMVDLQVARIDRLPDERL